jgi:hypothetical protein
VPKSVKVPFLNTVTIAGRAVDKPCQINRDKDDLSALFKVAVNGFKGKKLITTFVDVICRGDIAESVHRRLAPGDS